ncbi:MAG: hypothetical protein U0797_30580 [Gemmataceae bacterium]
MGSRQTSYLAALALFALSAAAGRADMVNFNYAWSYGPVSVQSSGDGSVSHSISGNVLKVNYAGGTVSLTLPSSGSGNLELGGPGGFSLPTASFTAAAGGSPPSANQFFSAVVNETLHVTDQSNGKSGDLGLQTTITGVITPTSTYLLASSFGTGFSPGLTLGDHRFGLNGSGFGLITPGGPALSFSMAVKGESTSVNSPEPSSLFLALGVASLGGVVYRRRPRRVPA